ncbi:hypothetical protein FZC78_16610 [Rossellomorea vietnamensis]|uniref:Uncharacterized protein n=1 Tax=Rossellomorea vietnamensis TaxID=218284 RepID=A0A5D4NMW6_9BACI|nr:hypothetical protein [Rossellomorea vietnamensis]TYS15270.1 hypothetical protein FZC78_16610 [Rossellomorea vietnamensis]
MANDYSCALIESVFSSDFDRAMKIAGQPRREYQRLMISSDTCIFLSGYKREQFGRYHEKEGLYAFCSIKSTMIHKGKCNKEMNWFPYKQNTADWLKRP